MFSNQISARDLFSTKNSGPERNHIEERDFSQLQNAQYTQYDMSQYSQEMFPNSQSQVSTGSESQGRKVQTFEKYMAKPSLFRSNSQNRIQTSKTGGSQPSQKKPTIQPSYQQQLNVNKAKAKERDERDMLSSIVHIVRECSDDVKQNLVSLKTSDDNKGEQLQSSIRSLAERVEESSERILQAVHAREEQYGHVAKLQRQVADKDEQIQQLMKQLAGSSSKEQSLSLLDSFKSFLCDQHTGLEQKIQRIVDTSMEELKLLKEHGSAQRTTADDANKHYQDIKYTGQRQLQDAEKRILDELVGLRDDFERQKRDTDSFYRKQLQSLQQKQSRDLEQSIQRGIENSSRTSMELTNEFYQERQMEMKDFCQSQQSNVEKIIKAQGLEQSKQYLKNHRELFSKHVNNIQSDLNENLNSIKTLHEQAMVANKENIDTIKELHETDTVRPWQNDFMPQKVQEQLNDLHNKHQSEIKRLEKQIEKQRQEKKRQSEANKQASQTGEKADKTVSELQNVYQFDADDTDACRSANKQPAVSLFPKSSGLISPRPLQGTTWNSRAIFGRTNHATVLPQRHETSEGADNAEPDVAALPAGWAHQSSNMSHSSTSMQTQPRQLRNNTTHNSIGGNNQIETSRPCRNENENVHHSTDSDSEQASQSIVHNHPKRQQKRRKGRRKGWVKRKKATKPVHQPQTIVETTTTTVYPSTSKTANSGQPQASADSRSNSLAMYDFHDEISLQHLWKPRSTGNTVNTLARLPSKRWLAASPTTSENSSENSSPVSVTEVVIRRKVRCERRTPEKAVRMTPSKRCYEAAGATDNFLGNTSLARPDNSRKPAVPSLNWGTARNTCQEMRAVQRVTEKRKLFDFEGEAIEMMQCTQRRQKHCS